MIERAIHLCILLILALTLTGCGAAVVGGAGYAGYESASDQRSIGTMVDDSVLLTKVKTKMISDEFVKARHIDVDVLNGVVYLIGVVESASQKRMAADLVRGIEGIRRVENQLVVGNTSAGQILDDSILTSKIRTELFKDPDIRSSNVDVDTINNVVTVTGIVSSYTEKQKVLQITHETAGSRKVVDNISVKE